ncbi:MAG TPA: hypothetical protein PLM98_03760 [Thiolinea sp.]|nr:hypothetical protein [Thiolinea sp.]
MQAVRKLFIMLAIAILLIALLFSVFILIPSNYYYHRSKQQAESFCEGIPIGDSTLGLLDKGLALGADRRHSFFYQEAATQKEILFVTFKGFLLDRHSCDLSIKDQKVASKKLIFLD